MSMPQQPMNPYDSPDQYRPGMSTGAKVLLGLGIGCGVLVLVCCGGLMIGSYFVGRNLERAMSEDPQTIRAVTASIVDIDIPPLLAPAFSLDLNIPFMDRKFMSIAAYAYERDGSDPQNEHPRSVLALFQMSENLADPDAMKTQFESQMREAGRKNWEEAKLESQEIIEHEVNGILEQFTFGKGKRDKDGREVWQASGAFDGKGGPAMLFLQFDVEDFTEEEARGVIASMK